MAKEKNEDADREPESKGEIHERRQEKAKISSRYREAERNYPTTRATILGRTRAF
ncbi:hypothetical protein [Salarchaeum sp. JOR-1]|uniref:hypothetical protein n=1 Tax=Salarchaeum sp. JOR-1 TaxID=2599399 RepID=UPI001980C1C3|nr:hypothetical protein [Salarchaeum sp. JOR-1]